MTKCEHEFEPLGKGWRCKKCGWLTVEKPAEKPKKRVSIAQKADDIFRLRTLNIPPIRQKGVKGRT